MARRSSGGWSAPRRPVQSPPQQATRAPAPAPAPTQSQSGSLMGSIGSTIADGMGIGAGIEVAHRAVDAVMGPRIIRHETVTAEAAATSSHAMASAAGSNSCTNHSKAFEDCLNNYGSDISKCQFYLDMLSECRKNSMLSA